jgi:DNA invertase Pin-like site-specific DNA recombinase
VVEAGVREMKVALYIRVSTDEQDTDTQLAQVREIAPEDAVVFSEKQSAWKDNVKARPVFTELKERIVHGEFSALYVWDFDRLHRRRVDAIAFMQLCEHYGCKVYSYRQRWFQEIDKTPAPWNGILRRFLFEILAWVAEEESSRKSDRIKKAVVRKDGLTQSYRGEKWGRPKLNIDEKRIMALRSAGSSIRYIAKDLGVSRGLVHKTLTKMSVKDSTENVVVKKGSIE